MTLLDYSQASVLSASGTTCVLDGVGVSTLTWSDTTTPGAPSISADLDGFPLFSVLPNGIIIWAGRGAAAPHKRAAVLAAALDLPRPWFTVERRVLRYRDHIVPVDGLQVDPMGRVLI